MCIAKKMNIHQPSCCKGTRKKRVTWFDDFFWLCYHMHESMHFVTFLFSYKEHSRLKEDLSTFFIVFSIHSLCFVFGTRK